MNSLKDIFVKYMPKHTIPEEGKNKESNMVNIIGIAPSVHQMSGFYLVSKRTAMMDV